MTTPSYSRGLAALCLLGALSGCAHTGGKPAALSEDLRQSYLDGHRALQVGEYASAVRLLKITSEQAPPPYDAQAGLELAYAYYKQGDFAAARQASERFIQRQAAHPRADYAHSLRATAALQQSLQTPGAALARRERALREAYTLFQDIAAHFPASDFNDKARLSLTYIRQQLALANLDQAKADLRRHDDEAALARLAYVNEEFDGTPAAQEALALLDLPRDARLAAAGEPVSAPPTQIQTTPAAGAVAVRAAETPPAAEAPIAIHDPQWILHQAPQRYTLELLSAAPEQINLFVTRHRIQGGASYPAQGAGARQTLIHGLYPNVETAKVAAKQLGKRWGVSTPRIRRLGDVQAGLQTKGVLGAAGP